LLATIFAAVVVLVALEHLWFLAHSTHGRRLPGLDRPRRAK